jgi:hypothetical protein
LQSADEQVREVDMLLVMPTFDQAAKDKELAALLQTITTVMSDGIVLTKRKFDDAALTQVRPSSNPKLRQEIAQLQRTSAALRIQASMRVRRDAQAVRAVRGRHWVAVPRGLHPLRPNNACSPWPAPRAQRGTPP